MNIRSITDLFEQFAPLSLQEKYDNCGLLLGNFDTELTGVLISIDITEEVIEEAIQTNCNLIISHHPLIFNGIKNLTNENLVQRCIIKSIKNDIAIYAAHTNVDNILQGVNQKIADKIGLINTKVLLPKENILYKIVFFVPKLHAARVREAIFEAGAGHIGNYDYCSFNSDGIGTFRANNEAQPFVGEINKVHYEPEEKIEIIFPAYLKPNVISALYKSHPYEEPAFDLISLQNKLNDIGAGLIGELAIEANEVDFLRSLKSLFKDPVIKYTQLLGKPIKRVALCGGSGSSFLHAAIGAKADIYISGDFKYHEFFEADKRIIIADIGHFESEQFTKVLFYEIITKKMPTFAVRISEINTNPINYL